MELRSFMRGQREAFGKVPTAAWRASSSWSGSGKKEAQRGRGAGLPESTAATASPRLPKYNLRRSKKFRGYSVDRIDEVDAAGVAKRTFRIECSGNVPACGALMARAAWPVPTNPIKEEIVKKLLACTSLLALMSFAPIAANAADEAVPTSKGVSKEASEKATDPASGNADTSTGAAQQSSSPPSSQSSGAPNFSEVQQPSSGSADTSGGAAEQSSASPSSSAADQSKPIQRAILPNSSSSRSATRQFECEVKPTAS